MDFSRLTQDHVIIFIYSFKSTVSEMHDDMYVYDIMYDKLMVSM